MYDELEARWLDDDWDPEVAGERIVEANRRMMMRCTDGDSYVQYSRSIVYLGELATTRETEVARMAAEEGLTHMCGPVPFDLSTAAQEVCDDRNREVTPAPNTTTTPEDDATTDDDPRPTSAELWEPVQDDLRQVGCSTPESGTTLECVTTSGYPLQLEVYDSYTQVESAVATQCPLQDPNEPMVYGRNWTAVTADFDFAPQASVVDSDRC